MLKKYTKISEIVFILENIRHEDKIELEAIWGADWFNSALKDLKNRDFKIVYGFDDCRKIVPVAMGGFCDIPDNKLNIACAWLLTSKFIEFNKTSFAKILKTQISEAEKKYDILFNFIYESNYTAKGWLKKLGFKFDNPYPKGIQTRKGFEFFYKLI